MHTTKGGNSKKNTQAQGETELGLFHAGVCCAQHTHINIYIKSIHVVHFKTIYALRRRSARRNRLLPRSQWSCLILNFHAWDTILHTYAALKKISYLDCCCLHFESLDSGCCSDLTCWESTIKIASGFCLLV